MQNKLLVYQVLPRLFGNRNQTRKEFGSIAENGCGKFSSFTLDRLKRLSAQGFSHIWYTGVLRHATQTDYSDFNIPQQHADVVKGRAGSPYAVADYYDVDPDLADNVQCRMQEWEALINRTHTAGLKVIMDFVPNHVAREYQSIAKPAGIHDLGEEDDVSKHFSVQNNFYYCWGKPLNLENIVKHSSYVEQPAKATGNDCFNATPQRNDWYETIKLNYGVDYCDAGGCSEHFSPMPRTWMMMLDTLLFWASKGIDAFRCDMAEMVPAAFWQYATFAVRQRFPHIVFIGEVYNPSLYRLYLQSGFDYLYDKVGMYDCLRSVVRGECDATAITKVWQATDDIHTHMLYFLENHDEQRVASDFFAHDGQRALPAATIALLLRTNPFMLYFGQEYGERGMDKEGFSGIDGRTTIFDYWALDTLQRAQAVPQQLTSAELQLQKCYEKLLRIAAEEEVIKEGEFFDLMYANFNRNDFDVHTEYAFIRHTKYDKLLVAVNFASEDKLTGVFLPAHAFDCCQLQECNVKACDLMTNVMVELQLRRDAALYVNIPAFGMCILKFSV